MSAPPVRVELGDRSYEVHVGEGTAAAALIAAAEAASGRVVVLADERVTRLHGDAVRSALATGAAEWTLLELPAGEAAKTMAVVEATCSRIVEGGFERGDLVVGLGGGAATDVAGFVAAILLRGVRWVSIPTTLLGQVDAAVGGKTGVNLPQGKNLAGCFHQPTRVACDPSFLATLPERELRAGLAEVVKTAWIGDPALFEAMEKDPPRTADHPALTDAIRRCVAVKAGIVSRDEREGGVRATLNFGHTLGHAIETEGRGRWLHGEAVSLGLVAALHLSVAAGRCEAALAERLRGLLEALGLPTSDPGLDPDSVLARTQRDKKRSGGEDRYQLTEGLGLVSVARDLPEDAPRAALESLLRPPAHS